MRTKEFVAFIVAREKHRRLRVAGIGCKQDPIIRKYRFCNIQREEDRVTRWLRRNWYPLFKNNEDIWFAAVVARLLNLPYSLTDVKKYVLPWNPVRFKKVLQDRAGKHLKNFNAAYIVSTNGKAMDKVEYITELVLNPLWGDREKLRPFGYDTLHDYHEALMRYDGMGSFMAAQVIADIKYIPPNTKKKDWHTFAASGPGSRRGLNRVMGYLDEKPWREKAWHEILMVLRDAANPLICDALGITLHAQDIQNCLCEFDKYERARLAQGRPKQLYTPNEEPLP